MTEEYIGIGKILKAQGHHGAVRVLPLTDHPERFKKMRRVRVSLKGTGRDFSIEEACPHKNFYIVKFKEVADMNAAEELRGGVLEVARDELYPLPEGSYYIFDIVGLKVFDTGGAFLGEVTDVLQTGANDVYVVDTEGKPLLIPALRRVVREIDLPGRQMVVELPEGLVDL